MIRKEAVPATKEHIILWLKDWINSEVDKVIKGKEVSGLEYTRIEYIRTHMTKAVGNKTKVEIKTKRSWKIMQNHTVLRSLEVYS